MKSFFRIFILRFLLPFTLVISSAPKSQAADLDLHALVIFAAARHSGWGNEASALCAAYSQWVDVSPVNSPMLLSVQRYLNHFLGKMQQAISENHGKAFSDHIAYTTPFTGITFWMLNQGVKEGNLMKFCAGLHHLVDSYTHAGYGHVFGHAVAAHTPDEPPLRPDLYAAAIRSVFQALSFGGSLMPESLMDMSLMVGALPKDLDPKLENTIRILTEALKKPNFLRTGFENAETFLALPEVKAMLNDNVKRHKKYMAQTLRIILTQYKEDGFIQSNAALEAMIPEDKFYDHEVFKETYGEELDVRSALEVILKKAIRDQQPKMAQFAANLGADVSKVNDLAWQLNIPKVIEHAWPEIPFFSKKFGLRNFGAFLSHQKGINFLDVQPEVLDAKALNYLVEGFIDYTTRMLISQKDSDTVKDHYQSDGPIRNAEINLRLERVAEFTKKYYGIYVGFHSDKLGKRIFKEVAVTAKNKIKNLFKFKTDKYTGLFTVINYDVHETLDFVTGVEPVKQFGLDGRVPNSNLAGQDIDYITLPPAMQHTWIWTNLKQLWKITPSYYAMMFGFQKLYEKLVKSSPLNQEFALMMNAVLPEDNVNVHDLYREAGYKLGPLVSEKDAIGILEAGHSCSAIIGGNG